MKKDRKVQRVLAVKCDVDWKDESSKRLYNRLRDLSWQAARYKNGLMRRTWATLTGYRHPDAPEEMNKIRNQWRKDGAGELGSNVIDAAGREVEGVWKRDGSKMLAGAPLAEWRTAESISVRCRKQQNSFQGIRLENRDGQYVASLQLQSDKCADGCWIQIPVAKGTEKDWQKSILDSMVEWKIPIVKAQVVLTQKSIILRLTYALESPLPVMGKRIATISLRNDGRFLLRTETQEKDYTSRLAQIMRRKDDWDLIRRRVTRQIGKRKGHARIKRDLMSRLSWDTWLENHLQTWTREVANWCKSQGVGEIRLRSIDTGDWPAWKFRQLLTYKAEEYGIQVIESEAVDAQSSDRAASAEVKKSKWDVKRRREAIRDLTDQLTKRRKTA